MNVLGLFSGIGGFELGFQRAGFDIAAMCEIEPYAQSVLRKRFPGVPVYADVRELTSARLLADGIRVDVITGGFPCQDISLAGKGAGLSGERSGLWFEYRRVIAEVRPTWVVIENVSALRSRGLDTVLRQLAEIGYDAEWHCIPASAVGAPHRRDRVWIVAYAEHGGRKGRNAEGQGPASALPCGEGGRARLAGYLALQLAAAQRGGAGEDVADADKQRGRPGEGEGAGRRLGHGIEAGDRGWWLSEPDVGRVADGVPARVDRLRALGNAVVPQIPEAIALAIRAWELFDG